ncbi:Tyrosyl-tRNA synthetase 1 [Mycoplasmopsis agalactiae 14628]|uniref:Tyrosine--tRNA ligase n=1 Tax=Mycoplasmopsis agalactiae 14628 TaxID=1110504 RepID=I5D551_MYCAA|nr:tyrosine--tRNA ligase [Mycoplasmopsis agalactiae]EIN14810.1 Tyrosyl-tRNA synthetase 1 [Mycoplasmopsis agalactiae 14628]
MNILKDLEERLILKDISSKDKFANLDPSTTGVYVGFDPTAESLHLGNYILISVLLRFKEYGFKTYAVLGGATGMIGDPSFKDSERVLLDNESVNKNKLKIKAQLESFGLEVIDNYDFYKDMNVLEFLRSVGKLVNVSYMMAKESVQKRIQKGLSFTEFAYQLLQGFDFLKTYQELGIKVQLGGSDQWGNIVTGIDMISKVVGDRHEAVGVTVNLLSDENGKKIGKSTGGGALWIDKNMCSPFKMYQYLLSQNDSRIKELIYWFSFKNVSEINTVLEKHFANPSAQEAQKFLASEVVQNIFGSDELKQAENITKILFDKSFDTNVLTLNDLEIIENYLPTCPIKQGDSIIEALIKNKFIASNREAREFIQAKALKIDNEEIEFDSVYKPAHFGGKYAFFKKGKKQVILLKTV